AADTIVIRTRARRNPAILKPAQAADAAAVVSFEERRVALEIAAVQAEAQDRAAVQQVFVERVIPVEPGCELGERLAAEGAELLEADADVGSAVGQESAGRGVAAKRQA